MDKLLQKLRQNMAELSLQGDDFTRQIWHMYATFEEFLDHQQTSGEASPASHPGSGTNSGTEAPPPPAPPGGLGGSCPPRDVVTSPTSGPPATSLVVPATATTTTRSLMAEVGGPQGALSAARLARPRSPPLARDDLALASPRRRRRPRRLRRSVDNPLLDTISAIGDADSDEADLLPPAPPPSASSCWGGRLHPEAEVVGYAGSNSVDSGYKSACPTPELPDPAAYLDHRLEKRGSLASLASTGSSSGSGGASKPRIAMGTRVMARVPRSPSAGGSAPSPGLPRRPGSDGSYYELDQLAGLRGGLLGSPPPHTTPAEVRNPGFSRYSPRGSPAPQRNSSPGMAPPRETHVSRRAASPASPERRPRSASTGSRCSPSTRGRRPPGALRAGSPLLASTGSLPRASSPSRRSRALSPAAREESRPPPSWSRHSSPGVAPPPRSLRRPPSPIVGGHHETDLALLEREIDALLYGDPLAAPPAAPDYYDLDSEFPACSCPSSFTRPTPPERRAGATGCCWVSDRAGGSGAPLCPPACSPGPLHATPRPTCGVGPPPPSPRDDPNPSSGVREVVPSPHHHHHHHHHPLLHLHASTSSSDRRRFNYLQDPSGDPRRLSYLVESLSCCHPRRHSLLHHLPASDLRRLSYLHDVSFCCDLRRHSLQQEATAAWSDPRFHSYPTEAPRGESDDGVSDSSYDSACDYHLYEEIIYQAAATSPRPSQPPPPPLPARPPHLFRSAGITHQQEAQQQPRPPKFSRLPQPFPSQRRQLPEVQICPPPPPPLPPPIHHPSPPPPTDPQATVPPTPQSPPPPLQPTGQSPGRLKPTPPPKPPKPSRTGQSPAARPLPQPSPAPAPVPVPLPSPLPSTSTSTSTPTPTNSQTTSITPAPVVPPPPPPDSNKQQSQQQQQQVEKKEEQLQQLQQQQKQEEQQLQQKPAASNKPKQRSNLYSIFRDRDHRRCLSASLQQEYQKDIQQEQQAPVGAVVSASGSSCAAVAAAADDDYGFKVVPHVV